MTPPTSLPPPDATGYAAVNGVKLYYAQWGKGDPVILVEGGGDNTVQWGYLVPELAKHYRVIAYDTRCQGRSTCSPEPFTYELFASDLDALMDRLEIPNAAIVGWSDGAIVALEMGIHYPARVDRIFAHGANTSPDATNDIDPSHPPETSLVSRRWGKAQYETQSPAPGGYSALEKRLNDLWSTQPHLTAAQLQSISAKTWIVDGAREEFVKRSDTDFMAETIPNALEVIIPGTSHYAPWQRPDLFNSAVLAFLR
jgi:pimeloyl-ACP methyl ester carboxylesterase